jgi:hypothetical protein
MPSSKVPGLLTYLITLFTGAPSLQAQQLGDAQGVTVYDGPPTTGLDAKLKLYVGLTDPDSDAIEAAATWVQARGDLGQMTRDEQVTVECCAEAWSGTDDMATVRAAVFGITAAVETLIRADATQFGGNAALAAPGFAAGQLLQNNTTTGAVARIPFQLMFKSFT